jgi:CubicO group peptidase (beta-lactamase class C family)
MRLENFTKIFRDSIESDILKGTFIGMTTVVVIKGEMEYAPTGWSSLDKATRITEHSLFPIASITKTLTEIFIKLLVREGAVTLEEPIGGWIKELKSGPLEEICLQQLMSHTAGLPRDPEIFMSQFSDDDRDYYTKMNRKTLLSEIDKIDFKIIRQSRPLNEYHYSNIGYLLIALMLESVFGSSIEDMFEEKVLKPINMNHSLFFDQSSETKYVRGHDESGSQIPMLNMNLYNLTGGLMSNGLDLGHYLNFLLSRSENERNTDSWGRREINGESYFFHAGHVAGCKGAVVFSPKINWGFAYVGNTAQHPKFMWKLIEELT